jgi:membrane fusion protein (multidrug efflux system)
MKSRVLWILTLVAALWAIYGLGVAPRVRAQRDLATRAAESGRVIVRQYLVKRGEAKLSLLLPGNLQAFADTAIYARTTGYVARWNVDLGDRVTAGQLLAVIDSPEIDQQLNQARANLEQAQANQALARTTSQRWKTLVAQNAVSQQEADAKQADQQARLADASAAAANVQRLEQLKGFEKVTAPFDGVISARNVDVGNLVSPGAGKELFHLTQGKILRVYVDVPQTYAGQIRPGLPAEISIPEYPRQSFSGKVVRAAGALDAASRTLRTEVQIPNPDGKLLAGTFCEIHFSLAPSKNTLLVPSNDVIVRGEGTLVALIGADHRIRLTPVKLGRDFGTELEILDGIEAGAHLVENPSDALREGEEVEVQ